MYKLANLRRLSTGVLIFEVGVVYSKEVIPTELISYFEKVSKDDYSEEQVQEPINMSVPEETAKDTQEEPAEDTKGTAPKPLRRKGKVDIE